MTSTLLSRALAVGLLLTAGAASASTPTSAQRAQIAAALPGLHVVAAEVGDLNEDGRWDVLAVTEFPGRPHEPRDAVVLVQGSDGQLHLAERNPRLVPCAQCGGAGGDPLTGLSITRSEGLTRFYVSLAGGSRERWTARYMFYYESQYRSFEFGQIVRTVTDTETGQTARQAFGATDYGGTFASFDPTSIPEPELKRERQIPPPTVPAAEVTPKVVNPYAPKGPTGPVSCPAQAFPAFFQAFVNDVRVQRAFIDYPLRTSAVDPDGKDEPVLVTQQLAQGQVLFPVIASSAEQAKDGLTVSQTYRGANEVEVKVSKEDTDYQMSFYFHKAKGCWALYRLEDDTL